MKEYADKLDGIFKEIEEKSGIDNLERLSMFKLLEMKCKVKVLEVNNIIKVEEISCQ